MIVSVLAQFWGYFVHFFYYPVLLASRLSGRRISKRIIKWYVLHGSDVECVLQWYVLHVYVCRSDGSAVHIAGCVIFACSACMDFVWDGVFVSHFCHLVWILLFNTALHISVDSYAAFVPIRHGVM